MEKQSLNNRLLLVVAILLILIFIGKALDSREPYITIKNKVYYLLVMESFEKSDKDDNLGAFVRGYWCYDGTGEEGEVFLQADRFTVEGTGTLSDIKKKLAQSEPKSLQLKPSTIVSKEILRQWKKEGYKPINEYYEKSPRGLIYKDLLKVN